MLGIGAQMVAVVAMLVMVTHGTTSSSWHMSRYRETHAAHTAVFEDRFGRAALNAMLHDREGAVQLDLGLGMPGKTFRSFSARMVQRPTQVNDGTSPPRPSP